MMEQLIRWSFGVNSHDEYQRAERDKILSQSTVLVYWLLNLGMLVSLAADAFWVRHITAGTVVLVIISFGWNAVINVRLRKHGLMQVEAKNEADLKRIYRQINFQVLRNMLFIVPVVYIAWALIIYTLEGNGFPTLHETIVNMSGVTVGGAIGNWLYKRQQVIKAWENN
ncbi:hypothetical protein [Schleiferilactobacillus harbinensis]|uniref:DUF3278 domain-containing protein n=1 Tax=Schleiferilactobacillus harbinensis TaxID=304207 RepID=A0ABU7SZE6_9LACO